MIAPTPFFSHRGTHIRILEEARALERLGYDVVIVTYHNGDDIYNYIDTKIDVRRIRRWLFWYKKTEAGPDWQKIFLNVFLIVKSFNMIRRQKPDVIHAHLHEGVLIGRIMQLLFFWRNIPLVSDFHGSLVGEMQSHGYLKISLFSKIFSFAEKVINGLGDVALVSGKENIDIIRAARSDKKVIHLHDGVNIAQYCKKYDKKQLRKLYNIPPDKFVVIYTGALIENKGIKHFLSAIVEITKKFDDIHFVIGGFPIEWVEKYIDKNKLRDYVSIVSPLNYFDLPKINKLADVAVDPKDSSVQQASGKLLQYMAAEVGIICADRPTNHKYLSNNSALFLKQVNKNTVSDAIQRFYNDRELLNSCAANAKKDVEKFDWFEIGKKLSYIYKSLSKNS